MKVRNEILAFAEAMEAKLRKHETEVGEAVMNSSPYGLTKKLCDATTEIIGNLETRKGMSWAVDAANMAMLLWWKLELAQAKESASGPA